MYNYFITFFCVHKFVDLSHESSKDINCPIETPELENTIPPLSDSSYTATPISLFKQNHHEKTPAWFTKFEKLRNDQIEATNNNANQLNIWLVKFNIIFLFI